MSDDEPVELGENGKFKVIEEKSEQAYWLDLTDLILGKDHSCKTIYDFEPRTVYICEDKSSKCRFIFQRIKFSRTEHKGSN
jgi:hypothetical protein